MIAGVILVASEGFVLTFSAVKYLRISY
ncbi:glutamate decarboxylase, partial [Escherichia coli]|nr:glutamate decarboxylase [Escherichia coli]